MVDREKVMRGLVCKSGETVLCGTCAYLNRNGYCDKSRLAKEALALLEEQEKMIAVACDVLEIYASDAACDEFSEDEKQWEICEKDCGHGHYSNCWRRFLKWKLEKRLKGKSEPPKEEDNG